MNVKLADVFSTKTDKVRQKLFRLV